MITEKTKEQLTVIILLLIIGLAVYYPSFNLSLYGDEWIDVLQYKTHIDPYAHFSPLPGILSFIAPYGFTIFLIGNLFKLFGTYYAPYFIISFLFRFAASVGFYFVCLQIGKLISNKETNKPKFMGFLSAALSLVGYTGIQTTDWTHYMNIYLASALFLFSLTFQLKFYLTLKLRQMYISLSLLIMSLIVGSLRLYPVLILIPFMDLSMYLLSRKKPHSRRIIFKFLFFLASAVIFWGVGLFGSPFGFYSYGDWSVSKFLSAVTLNPILALKSNLHLVGVLLIPDRLNIKPELNILLGAAFLLVFIVIFVKSTALIKNNVWLILFGVFFYFFTFSIWYFGPTSLMSSEHRYLFVVFIALILWLNSLLVTLNEKKPKLIKLSYLALLVLITIHALSTRSFFLHQLEKGRSAGFAKVAEDKIINQLPTKDQSFVYFDVDDGEVEQSLLFGLAVKTIVIQQNWDTKMMFQQYDDIKELEKAAEKKAKQLGSQDQVKQVVFGYQVRNLQITDITPVVRQTLFSKPKRPQDQSE